MSRRTIFGLLLSLVVSLGVTAVTTAPAQAAYYKPYVVCSGQVGSACWNGRFREVNPWTEYCSSSVGCFQYPTGSTHHWKPRAYSGPGWTAGQVNCVASIALAGLAFWTGPLALAVAGGGVTVWGCYLSW